MQVCTSLQTDNYITLTTQFFTGRMPFLPPNQQRQSTEGKDEQIKLTVTRPTCSHEPNGNVAQNKYVPIKITAL